jgi:hypothetical protein
LPAAVTSAARRALASAIAPSGVRLTGHCSVSGFGISSIAVAPSMVEQPARDLALKCAPSPD